MLMFADAQPWSWSLPPTLQLWQVYTIMAICVATRGMCATIPDAIRLSPWGMFIIQIAVLFVGCVMAWFIVPASHIYALGIAWISSAMAVQFYALALSWIETKVRAVLGIPSVQEPLQLPPQPGTNPKP